MCFSVKFAVLATLSVAALVGRPRAASAADGPAILVVEGTGTAAPKNRRLEIRAAIERAIKQSSVSVVPVTGAASARGGCEDGPCAVRAGVISGATHVIFSNAAYADDGYQIRLELFDVRTGRQLGAEGKSCPVCAFQAFVKALRESTTLLCTRGLVEPAQTPEPISAPPTPPPVAEAEVARDAPIGTTDVAAERAPVGVDPLGGRVSVTRRVLPMVGVGVGLLTAGIGAFVLSKNGERTCDGAADRCPFVRDTLGGGFAMLGSGLVTAAVSGIFWYRTPPATIAISPAGIAVAGQF